MRTTVTRTISAVTIVVLFVFAPGCDAAKPLPAGKPSTPEEKPVDAKGADRAEKQSIVIDGVTIGEPTWNFAILEKDWGVKLKTLKPVERDESTGRLGSNPRLRYKALVEFTRDLKIDEVESLMKILPSQPLGEMDLFFLDKDNVVVGTARTSQGYEGTITGTKGDAFWLKLTVEYFIPEKATRGEFRRITERPFAKDKKDQR
ncbi:hypothetical protein AYO40_00440 [Planctomycetaceae bacterium SCGC AG-212-D15]|nr:hypothetical protein AYO40_00440 [Planctomycetaceae bacterium SCGC AG-212-D15]